LRPAGLIANFGAVTPLLLAGWLARVPVRIAWYHTLADYDSYDPRLSPRRLRWLNGRRRQVYRLATHVIAVSEAARQDAIQTFGLAPKKCLVVPNAMRDPLEEFPELQNADHVGNPLLRKGGSQTLCQTFLHPLRIPQAAQEQQTTTGTVGGCLRNPQNDTKVLGRGVQSEHVNDPAGPGLRSAERGGSTLFQKGGPNIFPQKGVPNICLVCVGTLHRAKGQDVLLRAMARLKPAFPGLRCVFFGEGPAAAELRQLAAGLDIASQCHFAGNRPRLEVLQAMQEAAVVVCPSRSEAFGYVVLEAMALGRPVVAAAAGGIPEIVRDRLDGKLFPIGDDQALAAVLPHVLSTPSEAEAWGQHGRERFLGRFALSQRLPGLIQQLETLLRK
jgi:glycosyltransferase involved in cell wall biosynthesis